MLEDGDRAVTRQSAGQTGYDGAVQLGAVGMEAERSTDETGGADRDAAGTTTTGSTDMTTTSVGVAGMEVERSTDGTDTTAAPKKRYRKRRKETAKAIHARRDAAKARKRRDG